MVCTLALKEKLDFGWIVSEVPANVAGVFTTNKVIAAPLKLTKNSIEKVVKCKLLLLIQVLLILVLVNKGKKMPLNATTGRK